FEALNFALKLLPGTPFIFVCGTLDERSVMKALQDGAIDYVLKDQLARLCAIVRRAAREGVERQERERVERRLAAFSQLGRSLGAAASPREAARLIAGVAEGLFGWDALTLDSYLAEDDLRHAILHIDTLGGNKAEIPPDAARRFPSVSTRRVLGLGAE